MHFLDPHDDVQFIIAKHLTSDCKINKKFITKSDDDLQKILFGEVKEMKIDIINTYVCMHACMYVCIIINFKNI